jgi:predicted GNAT family N-acyltransferase
MRLMITESQLQTILENFVQLDTDDISEGIIVELWEANDYLELSRIIIPKDLRNMGMGTEVMNRIIQYSEQTNKPIYLTPDTSFGATSINRLKRFYSKFGFKKNRDFEVTHSMVRYPTNI